MLLILAIFWAFFATPSSFADGVDFSRPLSVGASISAGLEPTHLGTRVRAPATLLAAYYGSEANLITHAFLTGESSDRIWAKVPAPDLAQATVLVSIDLFFWDSTLSPNQCAAPSSSLQAVSDAVRRQKLYWIVGNVPNMEGSFTRYDLSQPCLESINRQVTATCLRTSRCLLVDFIQMVDTLRATGILFRGKLYTTREFLPDGLHLNQIGSEFIAEQIRTMLEGIPNPFIKSKKTN